MTTTGSPKATDPLEVEGVALIQNPAAKLEGGCCRALYLATIHGAAVEFDKGMNGHRWSSRRGGRAAIIAGGDSLQICVALTLVGLSDLLDPLDVALRRFTGTEGYTRVQRNLLATDGAIYLAERAQAYWLLDLIWSCFAVARVRREAAHDGRFVAKLERVKDEAGEPMRRADFTFHAWTTDKVLYRQHIPLTDFPLESIELYVKEGGPQGAFVVMVPSED